MTTYFRDQMMLKFTQQENPYIGILSLWSLKEAQYISIVELEL